MSIYIILVYHVKDRRNQVLRILLLFRRNYQLALKEDHFPIPEIYLQHLQPVTILLFTAMM